MEGVLAVGGFVLFLIIVVPLLFKLKRKYLEKCLTQYGEKHGIKIQIEKVGIPPLRFWLKNRKGDCWGLVVFPDGTRKWARLRGGLYSGDEPLTFHDA